MRLFADVPHPLAHRNCGSGRSRLWDLNLRPTLYENADTGLSGPHQRGRDL